MHLRLADLIIEIQNQHPYLTRQCNDYVMDDAQTPVLSVSVPAEAIAAERVQADADYSDGYFESICAYRALCLELPRFDGFLLHAAVIAMEGAGYAFAANSGVGKSTHIRLWRQQFKSRVTVINGDKPIVRRVGGVWYAYGTPWCGKEGWQSNTAAPLRGLVFLRRGEQNQMKRLSVEDAVPLLFGQLLPLSNDEQAERLFALLDQFVREVPFYALSCTPDPAAAEVAYQCLVGT